MNQIQLSYRKYLFLAAFFSVSSYLYRAYSAFNYGDLTFLNPSKHYLANGTMIFMGAPVTWVLGLLGLVFFGIYIHKRGQSS